MYKKPEIIINHDFSEGVYAASGTGVSTAGGTTSDCILIKKVDQLCTDKNGYRFDPVMKHTTKEHQSLTQDFYCMFNVPVVVTKTLSSVKGHSGDGTNIIVLNYADEEYVGSIADGDFWVKPADGSDTVVELVKYRAVCND